jgi:hypothetical protein
MSSFGICQHSIVTMKRTGASSTDSGERDHCAEDSSVCSSCREADHQCTTEVVRYQVVRWKTPSYDEPILLYSEVDDDGWELRKVEEYASGRRDIADAQTATGSTMLSEVPLPTLEQTNEQDEFEGRPIGKQEFEVVWAEAWRWFDTS